ncbi:hypothetical protein C1645_803755 [Glomus cerebriforme]|uniref:Protein kinase domain-containing protein n=1 Tax=Glomus cerebriforme TaxID=658196 RepID=A0A397TG01_9GLOM|nr:hypothetical protein C1645_803755 [Glomus cerebriforme]
MDIHVLNSEKTKKRAIWGEHIYFELLEGVSTEFHISVYNSAISGPDGRLGEATGNFKDTQQFKFEENRITLKLMKQGEEEIGEVFFYAHLLSNDPPRNMMEKISDPNIRTKKVGMLLMNNVKFKNLAGRKGTLEVKLRDEHHSTDGYWNTTTKEWRYPITLTIYANPILDLVIQCRYTEHERAFTRISLGPDGIHEHIWKSLMNGPYKVGELSLQDQDYDSGRIEFTLSCHRIVTSKILFNEEKLESPFVDPNRINEENNPLNTTVGRVNTINSRTDTINQINNSNQPPEQNFTISVAQKVHYDNEIQSNTPKSPSLSPQSPPLPQLPSTPPPANIIGDSTNVIQPIHQNIASLRHRPRLQADSSQFRNNSIPVPPKHPRRNITIEEEIDSGYIPVNSSPPSSDRIIDTREKPKPDSIEPSPLSYPPNIPHRYKNPNPEINLHNKPYRISPPPPPYPKQTNNTTPLKIICQRYVIVNPLRLGNLRGRRDEPSLQNKLYKGHHILSMLNVIIKEFGSQVSWEYETTYLKELKSRHVVKWVDMESDPSTGEYYSITEYYGRTLQLEACKFNVGKIRQVFKNICTAVSWIHSKDVVHLDLNPSNIICKEGKENHKIRICDFETSRQFGDVMQVMPPTPSDVQSVQSYDTRSQYSNQPYQTFSSFTHPQFTVGYTCPELLLCYENNNNNQIMDVPAYFNQDIFSVGCILYFLHSNKALYSTLEELDDIVSLEKGFEYKVRKEIQDERAADLILKCVNRKPSSRPTIEEVLDDRYFNSIERNHSRTSRSSGKSESYSRNSHDSVKSESLNDSDDDDDDDDEGYKLEYLNYWINGLIPPFDGTRITVNPFSSHLFPSIKNQRCPDCKAEILQKLFPP